MLISKKLLNQSGAASMIVVIFISIILTTITIGFIRLAINEQRQSTDSDLSQRAYYAAESGLEDARRAIKEYQDGTISELNGDTCALPQGYDGTLSTDPDFDVRYSCMFIDLLPSVYKAQFDSPNQTKQFDVVPTDSDRRQLNMRTMIMKWHLNDPSPNGDGVVGSGGTVDLRSEGSTDMPQSSNWDFPAMMEVTFIAYKRSDISRANIVSHTTLTSPNTNTSGNAAFSGRLFRRQSTPERNVEPHPSTDGQVLEGGCNPDAASGDYVCEMQFDFTAFPIAEYGLTMRITNHYSPTTLELIMTGNANGTGRTLFFGDAQAHVDVTGESGTVRRRVEATLDLGSPELLPDFTIQSATDICKNFTYTTELADFGGIRGTSCLR